MTQEEMAQLAHRAADRLQELLHAGQNEYAHDPRDAFRNFESLCKDLGITREQVLWVYLKKHLDGILAYINGHRSQREDIVGRLDDARVYLTLLEGMLAAPASMTGQLGEIGFDNKIHIGKTIKVTPTEAVIVKSPKMGIPPLRQSQRDVVKGQGSPHPPLAPPIQPAPTGDLNDE